MRSAVGRLSVLLLSVSFAAGCAPGGPESEEYDDVEDNAAEREDSIIGGSAATSYPESVLIEMKQNGFTTSICSGSVIAPTVVLTAGHCVHGYNGWSVTAPFASNQKANASQAETYDWNNSAEFVDPNQHDVGLIYLDKAIQLAAYPTVAAQPITIGSAVQNIGRIDNGQTSYSKLFIGPPVTTKSGSSYGYPLDYVTSETIQSGDSGGPVVVPGTHQIVAVNSGAGGGTQVLARVDLVSAWIQQKVAAHGAPAPAADPCGGVTYEGQCNGSTVQWCENNQLNELSCSASGRTCGWDQGGGYYNCL